MSDTPAQILAAALKTHRSGGRGSGLTDDVGLKPGIVSKALKGYSIGADAHLRLCAALRIDPSTGHEMRPQEAGAFDFKMLGAGLFMRRMLNKHSLRVAASEMGITHSTMLKIEQGEVTSIMSVLAACRYVGVSPFHYVKGFTKNNGLTTLNPNGSRERSAA